MADLIPKERYISREFVDLEMERLWPRVWQIACREEELPRPGDYVEYVIGDQSILVVRGADGNVGAYHNACLHRGTRLGSGVGSFAVHAAGRPALVGCALRNAAYAAFVTSMLSI